ncbi:MAG: 16S rRNA (cytosine(1402)-N(4))-methyltransferase RsmH [Clostridia bacterium]
MMNEFHHTPIMKQEVLALLNPMRGGIFVDGTLGGGGHAEAVLEMLNTNGRLIGIDRDASAIEAASDRLSRFDERFTALRGNFFDMKALIGGQGIQGVDGILLDLGVSSYQLDTPSRGFSYHDDAPLDMRMDERSGFSAQDVVNGYTSEQLFLIIKNYGEERYASRIANAIVAARPLTSTTQLAETIKNAIPAAARREGPHPARRTFQAIRIEVNGELNGLEDAIRDAHDLLNPAGVLAVITFHSLEDRIAKQVFRTLEKPCTCDPKAPICSCGKRPTVKILTKKPIVADQSEIEDNPRSRSAKLRAIEKL